MNVFQVQYPAASNVLCTKAIEIRKTDKSADRPLRIFPLNNLNIRCTCSSAKALSFYSVLKKMRISIWDTCGGSLIPGGIHGCSMFQFFYPSLLMWSDAIRPEGRTGFVLPSGGATGNVIFWGNAENTLVLPYHFPGGSWIYPIRPLR